MRSNRHIYAKDSVSAGALLLGKSKRITTEKCVIRIVGKGCVKGGVGKSRKKQEDYSNDQRKE